MTPVVVYLPLRIVSVANRREHWSVARARTKEHRGITHMLLCNHVSDIRDELLKPRFAGIEVRLLRVAPRAAHTLDAQDNLRAAFKACVDGVTDALCACRCGNCVRGRHKQCGGFGCVDDADPRVAWTYGQSRGERYEVRIEIRPRAAVGEGTSWAS